MKNYLKMMTVAALMLSCTSQTPDSNLSKAELQPYNLELPKIEPEYCYALTQENFGDTVFLRGMDNELIEVDLIGSFKEGMAVYTHDQYQYKGNDGAEKVAIRVTVKESTPFRKEVEIFGKTGIIAFDYSSSAGSLSPEKIAELEKKSYQRFLNSKTNFQRCQPNKAAECSACGDMSNPNFEKCIEKNKQLKCPGYSGDWVKGVCRSDCGTIFASNKPKHNSCLEAKFKVTATYISETCNDFSKHTCSFSCDSIKDFKVRQQCQIAHAVHCK